MRRLCLPALVLAVALAFLGQATAACVGGAPDGRVDDSEQCDPMTFRYAGRCTDDCLAYPINGWVSPFLDGWDFYLENATLRAFNPAANGSIDCARWFPAFVALVADLSPLTCTLDAVADEWSIIHLRMKLIYFDDFAFKNVIAPELFVTADLIDVKAPAAWASVFPWWVGGVKFTVYSLDYALRWTGYHELVSRVWYGDYAAYTSEPIVARKITWIPDCIIAQGTYKWGNEDFNVTTDLIPTIDVRGSSNAGAPVVPYVVWSLANVTGAPEPGVNPDFDAARGVVEAACADANSNFGERNQVLQLPWYAMATPVASSGVNKYATWVFRATWSDTGSQIAPGYEGWDWDGYYNVTVYDSSVAPPTIVTIDSSAETWANGPARTLSARAVSVCPGVDELTNYSTASLPVSWNWRNSDLADYENTYLLPDAGATTATTTARASFLPADLPLDGVKLDLYVAAGGKTLPVDTFIGLAPSPYKVNIRNGGGTHGRDTDWTITASVQGIEIEEYEFFSDQVNGTRIYGPFVGVSCYANSPYTGKDLCDGLRPTNNLDVYTWTVPADLLFPGSYKFYVDVGRQNSSEVFIGASDSITATITSSPPPEVAVSVTGFFSGRYTPVDPRVEQRIVNPLFNSAYTYRWTVGYGNPNDVVTSSDGQVLIIPKNRLRQNKQYEIRLTATDASGNVGVATGHFATKNLLAQVACQTPPGNRTLFNKMHLTCVGAASEFLAAPIRYQVRGYLNANFSVGDDSWLPLSGFSTINDWDIILPYNIRNVTVYAEDQAGAYATIQVDIPALPPNVNRTFSQTLSVLRGGISNAQRTGDAEALYNIGTALAAVLNGVLRNDTTDANRRELIRTIIAPDFVADLDSVATDSALRFVSYLTTRSDFLPDLPQRLIGQIFSWIKSNTQPIIEATDFELSDTLVTTLTDVLDRLSSPSLATIRDAQPLIDYQDQVEFIIDNFFQTQVPLPANRNFTYSGPVGNFKILISTYAPRGSNSTPGVFGGRDGANVTFTIPSSLWDKINASDPVYPIVVIVTDIGVNYYGYLPGVQPGAVLTNLVSLRFFDGNAVEIPINDTLIQVSIVTHSNNTGLNILPAFVNETSGLWDSAGLTSRGTRFGRILRGRQEFVFTTTHLTTFTAFQADFIVTPPIGNLAQLADSDPNYVVTAILIIMAAIGGGILLVVLAWLGVRLADQRTYHPVTNRSSLIRIREKKEVPTEEDYMSPSQSDSSMVSVHLRRPYYDNGLVIYEDEDSVRSHRSDDEGVDEDEPRSERSNASASDRSRSRSRSASNASGNKSAGSRTPRSRSPSPSNRSSPRSSAKSSPRD